MAYFGDRRSPSLESISTVTSMLSSADPPSLGISIQGPNPAFGWIDGERKDWLHERGRMRIAPTPSDDKQPNPVPLPPALDVYPMHERFYFLAGNIYFLVSAATLYLST